MSWDRLINFALKLYQKLRNSKFGVQEPCPVAGGDDDSGQSSGEAAPEQLLFSTGSSQDPVDQYPRPEHVSIFWRAFLDNVHPITKMVHSPTLQKMVELSCQNVRSIARNNIALLFAVHLSAITSMSEEECLLKIGTPRRQLLKKYLSLSQLAFVRVGLLQTTDFTIVTAYVAYLVSLLHLSNVWQCSPGIACNSRII
jgi:hypothetical protein